MASWHECFKKSCLMGKMKDREAWSAVVHGVASPALPLGREFPLAADAAWPWPCQAPARSKTGSPSAPPRRKAERRPIPVRDGELGDGSRGGT